MNRNLVKTAFLVVVSITGLWMTSCNEEEPIAVEQQDILEVESDANVESSYTEIVDLSFAGIIQSDPALGGRVEEDPRLACATVSTPTETSPGVWEVTIDFGTGCEVPTGRIRKGIIKVTHDGKIWDFGSAVTIELVNFSINDVAIEGTRTVTNKTTQTDLDAGHIVHQITMTGGKVTFLDGTFATREITRTRTWVRDTQTPLNDELWFEGSASGTNRNGVAYTMTITKKIVFTAQCAVSRVFIPVEGTKEIVTDRATIVVDFGAGTCDKTATVTVNGRSKEVNINQI